MMSSNGEVFLAAQYSSVENAQESSNVLVIYEKGKYGFIRFSFTNNYKGDYPINEYFLR